MPLGLSVACRAPRGFSLRPLAALLLLMGAPAHAGWFSSKADPAPAAGTSQSIPADDAAEAADHALIAPDLDRLPGNSTLDHPDDAELDDNVARPPAPRRTPAPLTGPGRAIAADADAAGQEAEEDAFEIILPSVVESDLDDSDLGSGQYSAEELAALGNLWDRLRMGAQMDTSLDNDRIEVQRNWYLRNNGYLERMARRATRYLHYTVSEAEKRGMPTELALLPIIESAYDPFAYSHAHAAGMWQFIPGTARYMGVKQNDWYDGRRDVIDSTRAAYDFLSLLYRKFGDWHQVLAAYNAGPGAVQRAIDRNVADGLPTDFWNLRLPAETRSYVPRFLAIAQIVKNPEAYGATLRPVLNQPFFRTITVPHQVDMPEAASIAGVSLKEFYQLNPGFKRQFTDPDGPHRLLVPAGLPSDYEADIAALPVPRATLAMTYTVRRGDTLFKVARQFSLSPQALRDLNKLKSDALAAGQVLTITRGNVNPAYLALRQEMKLDRNPLAERPVVKSRVYKVRRGDTLASIARRQGISVKALASLNGISTRASLRAGQVLTLQQVKVNRVATGKPPKGLHKITHTVKKGDTLSSIGRRYNVSVAQLRNWNGRPKTLNPGHNLVIYVSTLPGRAGR